MGVRLFHFLGLPDGSLEAVVPLAEEICALLRQERYDAVFCPDPYLPYEAHRDHIVVGQAVAQAAISTSLLVYPRGTQTRPYEMQAIALHKSQISKEQLAQYRMYFTLNGAKLGAEKGYKLAEGLKVLAPMHLHCIVEDS